MDVVALTSLSTSVDTEVPLLAADLGVAAFEARQKLAGGFPCVLLFTTDREKTAALVAKLRGRGHGVLACDTAAVVSASAMLPIQRFHFEPDAWVIDASSEGGAVETRLSFVDIAAVIRASHRHASVVHEQTKERKFRPVAALATGGLVMTKTIKQDVTRVTEEREQVLYVFRRGGEPCLLGESSAHYAGLGEAVRPTRLENFNVTMRMLKELAPEVPFDERLTTVKKLPSRPTETGTRRDFDPETGGVDLLAHLLAMWLSTGR